MNDAFELARKIVRDIDREDTARYKSGDDLPVTDIEILARALLSIHPHEACPCWHTTPCHERCTCVTPLSSSGCSRCCRFGSDEQRKAAAHRIAAALEGTK